VEIGGAAVSQCVYASRPWLHVPSTRLTRMQKGLYYSGIALFNTFPLEIKQAAHDIKKFKHTLKAFLVTNSFYSLEEHFNIK
jgi:hypothetical protein